MKYDCLIIDDEEMLSKNTYKYFNMCGLKTEWAADRESCMEFFRENQADLILLDINLGNDSGFDLCGYLRETTNVPILFISAPEPDTFVSGKLKIDFAAERAFLDGREIELTIMESKLLLYLAKNNNRVVTKDELFKNLWEDSFSGDKG